MFHWRPLPTSLLGQPLPRHLRGWRLLIISGSACLKDVAEFLDARDEPSRPPAIEEPADSESADSESAESESLALADAMADLDTLVNACLDAREASEQESVRALLQKALGDAGVREVGGVGDRFDPERHRAVMHEPTADEHQDGLVARTLRAGYAIHGRPRRLPEVSVYRWTPTR